MTLPPPGSDPTEIAAYVDLVVREFSNDDRRLAWEAEAERGLNLYLGNHFKTNTPTDGAIRIVLNRIQNCIVAVMAIQIGDPPKFTFTARESGEPPIYYLNTDLPAGAEIAQQVESDSLAAGEPWTADQPLPEAEVQNLQAQIAKGEMLKAQAAAVGQPPPPGIIPPEVLVEVSDRTSAEAVQTVFDGMSEAADVQLVYAENVLNKNVLGLQSTLFEFDDDEKRFIFTNVLQKQVFLDPTQQDFARQQIVIYDELISADEAKARYPELTDAIDDTFAAGTPMVPGSRAYNPAFRNTQNYYRKMGFVRHAWFRNQPYPMTEDQAVDRGRVVAQDVPTGQILEHPDLETGVPIAVPQTRRVLAHPETGEELTPTVPGDDGKPRPHPKWPTRMGIRQIRIVANTSVDDRECEFVDIPLPPNVNIPVPYSPYGQGEPVRLEGLQMALNFCLSAIVTHQRYNACPPELMPESVAKALGAALEEVRSRPNQRIIIPDALLSQLKSIKDAVATLDVAAVPADFWKLLQFLVEMIDKEGNQSDVMSGNASATWSGEAIASLQNAASQVIKAKSMYTEHYLRRLARLMVGAIVDRMTPADWRRYCSKYPWQALQALHSRAKAVDRDISVQIASGSGAAKQSQTNGLVAARQSGVPISDPTLMERLDVDPDAELTRQADFNRKRAAAMPQQTAVAPAGNPAANNDPNDAAAAGPVVGPSQAA